MCAGPAGLHRRIGDLEVLVPNIAEVFALYFEPDFMRDIAVYFRSSNLSNVEFRESYFLSKKYYVTEPSTLTTFSVRFLRRDKYHVEALVSSRFNTQTQIRSFLFSEQI